MTRNFMTRAYIIIFNMLLNGLFIQYGFVPDDAQHLKKFIGGDFFIDLFVLSGPCEEDLNKLTF